MEIVETWIKYLKIFWESTRMVRSLTSWACQNREYSRPLFWFAIPYEVNWPCIGWKFASWVRVASRWTPPKQLRYPGFRKIRRLYQVPSNALLRASTSFWLWSWSGSWYGCQFSQVKIWRSQPICYRNPYAPWWWFHLLVQSTSPAWYQGSDGCAIVLCTTSRSFPEGKWRSGSSS